MNIWTKLAPGTSWHWKFNYIQYIWDQNFLIEFEYWTLGWKSIRGASACNPFHKYSTFFFQNLRIWLFCNFKCDNRTIIYPGASRFFWCLWHIHMLAHHQYAKSLYKEGPNANVSGKTSDISPDLKMLNNMDFNMPFPHRGYQWENTC